jgi:predicted CopG family antitoxin
MSKQLTKFKHIPVKEDTYKQIHNEGKFGESFDTVLKRILAEREKQKQGELVIS